MLSNRQKRYTGVRYAKINGLDYKEIYSFIKEISVSSQDELWNILDIRFKGYTSQI